MFFIGCLYIYFIGSSFFSSLHHFFHSITLICNAARFLFFFHWITCSLPPFAKPHFLSVKHMHFSCFHWNLFIRGPNYLSFFFLCIPYFFSIKHFSFFLFFPPFLNEVHFLFFQRSAFYFFFYFRTRPLHYLIFLFFQWNSFLSFFLFLEYPFFFILSA